MPFWIALSLVTLGCGARSGLEVSEREPVDSGVRRDAGQDAGPQDGGRDAGPFDAGFDAGPPDAGRDAGPLDAGPPEEPTGCADGAREAFRDLVRYPDIAGCGGGWEHPGIASPEPPRCGRRGGDDGPLPDGRTCGVADLCAVGWRICRGPSDVGEHSPDGCAGAHDAVDSFFATRMSGPGCGVCATGTAPDCTGKDCRHGCAQTSRTTNDVFGCGTFGAAPDPGTCSPLDTFSNNLCGALSAPWSCGDDPTGTREAVQVVKRGPGRGGVLCCRE